MRSAWPRRSLLTLRGRERTALRAGLAALCVVATVVGLACQDDSDEPASAPERSGSADGVLPRNVVTDRQIRATPEGSPQRGLLEFFQAVQFRDVDAARRLITRAERRSIRPERLRAAVDVVGPTLGKPRILSVRRSGDRAFIRVLVLGFVAGKAEPSSSSPATFTLARATDDWRIADLRYLTKASGDLERSERANDRR